MRTSEYMDKQILGLSRSLSDEEFSDFGSSFSNPSTLINGGSMDHIDFAKVGRKKAGNSGEALISFIDQKMKEHADNLMYKVDGLSARLTQLESRTRQLENTIDDFKESVDFNHDRTDGKLRELEHILREVLGGIQDLRDKQEIAEAKAQLEKLEISKRDQQAEKLNINVQGSLSAETLQFQPPLSHPVSYSPQLSPPPPPPPPPVLPYQNQPSTPAATAPQLPTHLPHNQIPSIVQPECFYPPTARTSDSTQQQYPMLSAQPSQSSHPALHHQPYQPAPQFPQSSQFSLMPQLQPPTCPSSQYHEEISYQTSKPPSALRYSHHSTDSSPQLQQLYGCPTKQTYDLSSSSEFPSVYSQSSGNSNFNDVYFYGGSNSRCSNSPPQFSQSASFPSGGSSYSQLPTAKILPHALPTATTLDNESGPDSTENRVPINDIVNEVVAMGFRRDLVRASVRKLVDKGQPLDFNAVLDLVMNNGEADSQSGKSGW